MVPDTFFIPTKFGQPLDSVVPSDWVELKGWTDPMATTVVNGEYRLNTVGSDTLGSPGPWLSTITTGVLPPRWFQVRRRTALTELTTVSMTFQAGGKDARWDVTTLSVAMVFNYPPFVGAGGIMSNNNLTAENQDNNVVWPVNRVVAGVKAFAVQMNLAHLYQPTPAYNWGIGLTTEEVSQWGWYEGLAFMYMCGTRDGEPIVVYTAGTAGLPATGGPKINSLQFAGAIVDFPNARVWFTHSGINNGASYFGAAGPTVLYSAAQVANQIASPGGTVAPGISFAVFKDAHPVMYYCAATSIAYGAAQTLQTVWPFAGGNAALPAGVTYLS
jgi:hypothetical protein